MRSEPRVGDVCVPQRFKPNSAVVLLFACIAFPITSFDNVERKRVVKE
jgi:hypothetical protein